MKLLCGIILAVSSVSAMAGTPQVLTDIRPVGSLVAQVMEGAGSPSMIGDGIADPHGGSLRPSEARALSNADVIFWVGPGLTPWLERPLAQLGDGAVVVALSDAPGLVQRPFRAESVFDSSEGDAHSHDVEYGNDKTSAKSSVRDHDHDAEHDHDYGHDHDDAHAHDGEHDHDGDHARDDYHAHDDDHAHDHGAFDPHFWLDPVNAAAWLDLIARTLSEVDPEQSALYAANAQKEKERLAQLKAEVEALLADARPRFVVDHDALGHFEDRFEVSAIAAVSDGDAVRPGPRRVDEVRRAARDNAATCLLVEPGLGRRPAVEEVEVKVIDPLGLTLEAGPELYRDLILDLARTIAACGGGDSQ